MPSKDALTVDEEVKVRDALNFPNSETVALRMFPGLLIDTHGVTYGQLRCLSPEASLNDQVMNTYFSLLQRVSKQALVLDTFFFKGYQTRNQERAYRMVYRHVHKKIRLYQVHELHPTFLYL
jgi:Ulp1 family protease